MTSPIDPKLTEPEKVARGEALESDRAIQHGEVVAQTKARAEADEESLTTEGQRAINRLWERTQAIIAISIVEVTLVVVAILIVTPVIGALFEKPVDQMTSTAAVTGLVLLSNLVGNVTGSYFTRTNHQKVGGVGSDRVAGR